MGTEVIYGFVNCRCVPKTKEVRKKSQNIFRVKVPDSLKWTAKIARLVVMQIFVLIYQLYHNKLV